MGDQAQRVAAVLGVVRDEEISAAFAAARARQADVPEELHAVDDRLGERPAPEVVRQPLDTRRRVHH
ncbi:hypothetical protein [Streptomyces sp. SID3343]|uniref:hypothetical protein n=1 Tax=Streptomyces sp. SID3343 TaxID=2690260 RepID=UPI001371126E|nr:hypothetical protein [Streptomyces sp. SID3343]MYV98392.1 hypothetical protein [Streptomyces sp. SID3343]